MEKFQEGFSTVAGSAGGQRTARVAGDFVHCSCGDTVWRRGRLGHGLVRAIQGRAAAAVPAVGARDAQPRYVQPGLPPAGPAGVRARIPPVHGRRSPRPTGWNSAAWWRSMAKPCAAPTSAASKAPRCTWSTSWQRRREWCLARARRPAATRPQGALEVLGMLSLEGCIVTADALHCHRPFAATVLERGADYVLALKENQSKLFAAVARRFARGGKRSVANSANPPPTIATKSRRATVIRDTTVAAAEPLPRRRRAGPHHLAPPRARKPADEAGRALLPALQIYARQATAARSCAPLGHREPAALGTRCRLQRGSQPSQKRQCAREPR